jgi:hypothetical protein
MAKLLKLPKLPKKQSKEILQAEVDSTLAEALRAELKAKGIKIREFMEWSAKAYLLNSNPKEAERLGIDSDDV